jgi:hypothetical protein
MIEPETAGPATAAPMPLHAMRRSQNSTCAKLWLTPSDRRALRKLTDRLSEMTGQVASISVLLRAGIVALDDYADRVEAERKKRPGDRGRREMALLWMLASAARCVGSEGVR